MAIKNRISKNIFLIGFMGAGKSIVGRLLADRLHLNFVDMDEEIEKDCGMSINEIFQRLGEEAFRDMESMTLENVSKRRDQIVSTGGGVVLREVNRDVMRKEGITIYLKAPVEILWGRIMENTSRPLLQVENPFEMMRELFSIRRPWYESADIVVETNNLEPEQVVKEVLTKLT